MMSDALGQAKRYVETLDAPPPFLLVVDIGHCVDLFASFDGSRVSHPFPNALANRTFFADLEGLLPTLHAVWEEPLSLDPLRRTTAVTREVAAHLAGLSKELGEAGHSPEAVATFLMRAIFTMFAEDVGLLPNRLFTRTLYERWIPHPETFAPDVQALWLTMNRGGPFGFEGDLLRFNGGLFAAPQALTLTRRQLEMLHEAARCDWKNVEPSIFGTLLERALDPKERHALGAHFTPRAYVERLVRATVEEPLRAEWDVVRTLVRTLVEEGTEAKIAEAEKAVRAFHERLCATRVLDPACGTGNFLYVTLDLFKRLEAEVVRLLRDLRPETGASGFLDLHGVSLTPRQLLGIEVKRWAKEIAELVLWIGWLQWHFRTHGDTAPDEPVLRDYGNIECRDAVLAWIAAASEARTGPLRAELDLHATNLASAFDVLAARAAELGRRVPSADPWVRRSLAGLRENLAEAIRAIERNALGRWRIASGAGDRGPDAYLIEIDLSSRDGETLALPAVLEDVMRDLAANARKYTAPGGALRVTLAEDGGGLLLRVSDTGRGIPEEEIEEVVRFGRRGRPDGRRQFGGGYGLTKACYVAHAFGGRIWIRSAPGAGTTVTIRIPHPDR